MADSSAATAPPQHQGATSVSLLLSTSSIPSSAFEDEDASEQQRNEEEGKEDDEEDSDVNYESDYTYDASDEDDDDDQKDASMSRTSAAAAAAAHESLVGKKRAASESPPARSKPAASVAKIAPSGALAAAAAVPQQEPHRPDLVLGSQCLACRSERHDPVRRCEQVQHWKRRRHELWTVSTDILQRCVDQYIQWVAERHPGMNGDVAAAAVLCRTHRWRVNVPLAPPRNMQEGNLQNNDGIAPGAANHYGRFMLFMPHRERQHREDAEALERFRAEQRRLDLLLAAAAPAPNQKAVAIEPRPPPPPPPPNNNNHINTNLLQQPPDTNFLWNTQLQPTLPRAATATATATAPKAAAGAALTGKQESGKPSLSDNDYDDEYDNDLKMAATPTKPEAVSFPTMSNNENDADDEEGANQKKAASSPAAAADANPIHTSLDSVALAKADAPDADGAAVAVPSSAPETVNETVAPMKIPERTPAAAAATTTAASVPPTEEAVAAVAPSSPKRHGGLWSMVRQRLSNHNAQTTNDENEQTAKAQGDAAEIGNGAAVEQEEKRQPETIALNGTVTQQNDPPGSACPICFDDEVAPEEMHAMDCGHAFCKDCWRGLVETMLSETHETAMLTHCPATGCETFVNEVLVKAVAPECLPKFEDHQRHNFVHGKRDWVRFCPGPDCDRIAIRPRADLFEDNGADFLCGACRTRFCFTCGRVPHQGECEPDLLAAPEEPPPAAAAAAAAAGMLQDMEGNQLYDARDDKKRKHCPKCRVLVEKTGGCNRMICRCHHAFCWLCLGDYVSYGGHFCGQVAPRLAPGGNAGRGRAVDLEFLRLVLGEEPEDEEGKRVLQELNELDRFAHHYNRYYAHQQGQEFAERQCPCLAHRQQNYTQMSGFQSFSETDFIQSANETLVASRRLLKYAYISVCNSARINEEDNEHSHLGFLHLERLERFTEELSGVSENALTRHDRTKVLNLIAVVNRCMALLGEFEFHECVASSKNLEEL